MHPRRCRERTIEVPSLGFQPSSSASSFSQRCPVERVKMRRVMKTKRAQMEIVDWALDKRRSLELVHLKIVHVFYEEEEDEEEEKEGDGEEDDE
ncbi:hypothetical protein ACE6H2_015305 [Prunus campanulata]